MPWKNRLWPFPWAGSCSILKHKTTQGQTEGRRKPHQGLSSGERERERERGRERGRERRPTLGCPSRNTLWSTWQNFQLRMALEWRGIPTAEDQKLDAPFSLWVSRMS